MSISSFIAKTCTDTAVYWGSPVNDGMGGKTFTAPVEIPCRWENTQQVLLNAKGDEIYCRAIVYTIQDLEEFGMLYHGTLDSLTELDPMKLDDAHSINRFEKIPALGSTTEFLRKAYLTASLSFGGF